MDPVGAYKNVGVDSAARAQSDLNMSGRRADFGNVLTEDDLHIPRQTLEQRFLQVRAQQLDRLRGFRPASGENVQLRYPVPVPVHPPHS
jgi:hypothetical protein